MIDWLCARMEVSRRKAKALLDGRGVLVNGRRVWMARHTLRAGDTVRVAGQAGSGRDVGRIVALVEAARYLVVDKSAGVLSVGDTGVAARVAAQLGVSGILPVHRLDRDTTGCLLLVRDEEALRAFVSLFRERKVQKIYHVIVRGRVVRDAATIRRPLDERAARTEVQCLDANRCASHLRVRIATGRTHQIRRHLDALGHPVLGDRQYGTSRRLPKAEQDIGRQMLHAARLAFLCPFSGAKVEARAPLPRDFRACLRQFGLG